MFNHLILGVQNVDQSQAFYDALLAVLGAKPGRASTNQAGHKIVFWRHEGNTFGVMRPKNGEAPTCANGFTLGFKCASPEQVKQFHDVAVAQGGVAIEDPPGPRGSGPGTLHLAYVRDPDGHKICAAYREPT